MTHTEDQGDQQAPDFGAWSARLGGIVWLDSSALGAQGFSAACSRALRLEACTYRSINSMLKAGLDREEAAEKQQPPPTLQHPNIRGRDYYHSEDSQEDEDVA